MNRRRPTPSALLRTLCFVTGTRAEFGLMANTLRAIQSHPGLRLQVVATGMHLDPAHGRTINQIRRDGWTVDATVPWKSAKDDLTVLATQTGKAVATLATTFSRLNPDIVLVVGDRVEAFAAATAAHLSGRVLAHVHGGDRALGQVDDALRHAITKLAHLHFPATKESADRILKLGEDKWRVHTVGSPGLDAITTDASPLADCTPHLQVAHPFMGGGANDSRGSMPALREHRYALVLLHPTDADDQVEHDRARLLLRLTRSTGFDHTIVLYPNNDPGSAGICRAWQSAIANPQSAIFIKNLPRPAFLGLLRDAAVLVGNSSSGIIEAASFGTPVLDVGPRQAGRERGENVTTVPFRQAPIRAALRAIWNDGHPRRYAKKNPYGRGDTARRIARTLATVTLSPQLRRKLIAY
jgi:UDP-N-acetylglucosamine 2-epimerase (non-hydrolysing)/GDP/UDP-N,N'-diacetylbacillosamine 2-epimerase (hydrolysing)